MVRGGLSCSSSSSYASYLFENAVNEICELRLLLEGSTDDILEIRVGLGSSHQLMPEQIGHDFFFCTEETIDRMKKMKKKNHERVRLRQNLFL